MKKLLVFHPYLTPYRIDLYNRVAQLYDLEILLTGSINEKNTLGFDLDYVNAQAQFKFSYVPRGIYVGRHLISLIFFNRIRSFRPSVVIAHELGINTLVAILCKLFFRYKLFVTMDDSPEMAKSYGRVRNILRWFVFNHSEAVLLVHPDVQSYLENKYHDLTNCQFVYFPIIQDDERLKEKILLAESVARELCLRHSLDNKKVILFVGRLERMKCPDMLLRVFQQLDDDNFLLIFVGDGSMEKQLMDYVRKNDIEEKVIFPGRLSGSSLYGWYRLADIFVLPSDFEPFGAVVNEALVAGCFVVVSDHVGANSLVDRSNGIVFRSKDELGLFEALKNATGALPCIKNDSMRPSKMKILFEDIFDQLIQLIGK